MKHKKMTQTQNKLSILCKQRKVSDASLLHELCFKKIININTQSKKKKKKRSGTSKNNKNAMTKIESNLRKTTRINALTEFKLKKLGCWFKLRTGFARKRKD